MRFDHLLAYENHDLWVKMYNLSRMFKTNISAVLAVMSGLDPHRFVFFTEKDLMAMMVKIV